MLETESPPAGSRPAHSEPAGAARPRHYRRWFWILVALALLLRVGMVLLTPEYRTIHDDRDYDRIARSVAHGHGYPGDRAKLPDGSAVHRTATYRPPAWPYALGGVYAIFGHDKTAARYVLALFGTGVVALIGLIARQLFDRRASLWATGIAAIYMPLILVGSSLISETLFLLFVLGALATGLAARRRPGRWRLVILAGVFVGLASLTRINGFLMLVPLGLLLWRAPRFTRRSLLAPAVLALVAVLTISPWTIRNAIETDQFIPVATETGETLAGTYNDASRRDRDDPGAWMLVRDTEYQPIKQLGLPGYELDKRLRGEAIDYALAHPGYVATVAYWNGRRLLDLAGKRRWRFEAKTIDITHTGWADAGVIVFWVVTAAALAALAAPRMRRVVRRAPGAVWLAPGLLALSALLVIGETPRFRAPVDPFIVLLAAAGLAGLGRARRGQDARA